MIPRGKWLLRHFEVLPYINIQAQLGHRQWLAQTWEEQICRVQEKDSRRYKLLECYRKVIAVRWYIYIFLDRPCNIRRLTSFPGRQTIFVWRLIDLALYRVLHCVISLGSDASQAQMKASFTLKHKIVAFLSWCLQSAKQTNRPRQQIKLSMYHSSLLLITVYTGSWMDSTHNTWRPSATGLLSSTYIWSLAMWLRMIATQIPDACHPACTVTVFPGDGWQASRVTWC